jgi:histidinol-phosphate aminotransferase
MVARYAVATGAEVTSVPWPQAGFPTDGVVEALTADTGLVVLTSPNNPTGESLTQEALTGVCGAAGEAVVVLDEAYVEFAQETLLPTALAQGALVLRTFSKAWGLAGLRVGYAVGPAALIARLRAVGAPYAVSALSMALVARALDDERAVLARARQQARTAREALTEALTAAGSPPRPSDANFVFFETDAPRFVRDACAALDVGVRTFPGRPGLERAVRVSCPSSPADVGRATRALQTALAPEALLFDLDGVLADVSRSYRRAIVETCASWGVRVDDADVARAKAAGDANCDWRLTQRLLAAAGVTCDLAEVTARFEARYQAGLWREETPLLDPAGLQRLLAGRPAAIVTGRPRADAERFLTATGLSACFGAIVCREDAPLKPDPAPVAFALGALGVTRAWMVGDTVDDIQAALDAGVVPVGVLAPGEPDRAGATEALRAAGAAAVLDDISELGRLL